MNEEQEKKEEGSKQEATTRDNGSGVQSPATDLVNRAKAEREALSKENERMEENLRQLREIEANRLLSGTAGAHIETQLSDEQRENKKAQSMADDIINAFKN